MQKTTTQAIPLCAGTQIHAWHGHSPFNVVHHIYMENPGKMCYFIPAGRSQRNPHTRQAPPHPPERGAPPTTDERRRHRPPIESLPPPREQAADPRKAARRRAPPLAAGTPENPIARAGGGAPAKAPTPARGRRGEPPAPPLFDCDTHRCPERRYILRPVSTAPTTCRRAKKEEAEAPPRGHPSHGYQISPRSA